MKVKIKMGLVEVLWMNGLKTEQNLRKIKIRTFSLRRSGEVVIAFMDCRLDRLTEYQEIFIEDYTVMLFPKTEASIAPRSFSIHAGL